MCKRCGKDSYGYRLCGDCKKEWKVFRAMAYEIVVCEIGENENGKQFNKRLGEVERQTNFYKSLENHRNINI